MFTLPYWISTNPATVSMDVNNYMNVYLYLEISVNFGNSLQNYKCIHEYIKLHMFITILVHSAYIGLHRYECIMCMDIKICIDV